MAVGLGFLRFLRVFKVVRILRLHRLLSEGGGPWARSEVRRRVAALEALAEARASRRRVGAEPLVLPVEEPARPHRRGVGGAEGSPRRRQHLNCRGRRGRQGAARRSCRHDLGWS